MLEINGARYYPGFLDAAAQARLINDIAAVMAAAPPFRPRMPRTDKPFSVMMTNCGRLGWVADRAGYRYQATHPVTGAAWPAMPPALEAAWAALSAWPGEPEACLVNLYEPGARMGLHQDRDEAEFAAPVVSLSLGDSAVFRIGGASRAAPTRSLTLHSGDALVLTGASRLAFHGIDRVLAGSSRLVPGGGRINLTLRRVTPFAGDGAAGAEAAV